MNKTKENCLFLDGTASAISSSERATAIAVSIISIITALTATTGNALTLFVFYKFQRLRTLQNLLITSLCVTDILTGAIVQPLFATRRLHSVFSDNSICTIRLTYIFFANLCTGASLLSVGLITLDRCIAITKPYRYVSSINAKAYVITVISSWMAWAVFTLLPFLGALTMSQYFVGISMTFITIILIVIISYGLIYGVVRTQRRKIAVIPSFKVSAPENPPACSNNNKQVVMENMVTPASEPINRSLQVHGCAKKARETTENKRITTSVFFTTKCKPSTLAICEIGSKSESEQTPSTEKRHRRRLIERFRNFSKEKRRANTIAIVITTLLGCYMPQIILLNIRAEHGDNADLILMDAWADLFVYINSTVNPIIYCLRNKDVKVALKSIFKHGAGNAAWE